MIRNGRTYKAISLRYKEIDWEELIFWKEKKTKESPEQMTAFLKYLIKEGLLSHRNKIEQT